MQLVASKRWEMIQGKLSVAGMACVAGKNSTENPVWLMYTARVNISFCLKTHKDVVTLTS